MNLKQAMQVAKDTGEKQHVSVPMDIALNNAEQRPDLTDIPKEAIFQMGAAFTFGHKKHGKNAYKLKPNKVSDHLSAALRHIFRHLDGETVDKESMATHLGCALARLSMAAYTMNKHPDLDDRVKNDE